MGSSDSISRTMMLRGASCSFEKEISCSKAGCAVDLIPLYNSVVFNTSVVLH